MIKTFCESLKLILDTPCKSRSLLPQVARDRSARALRDVPGHELHHAAEQRKLHGHAPLAAVLGATGPLEERGVRRQRLGVHALRGLERPARERGQVRLGDGLERRHCRGEAWCAQWLVRGRERATHEP